MIKALPSHILEIKGQQWTVIGTADTDEGVIDTLRNNDTGELKSIERMKLLKYLEKFSPQLMFHLMFVSKEPYLLHFQIIFQEIVYHFYLKILDYQGRFAEEDPESIATEALQSLNQNVEVRHGAKDSDLD